MCLSFLFFTGIVFLPLADASILGNSPSIIGKTIIARDGKRSVHRNPSLAISVSALGLPIVRETHSRGSLIPRIKENKSITSERKII